MVHLLRFLVGILAICIHGGFILTSSAVISALLWDSELIKSSFKTQDYLFKIVFGIKDVL